MTISPQLFILLLATAAILGGSGAVLLYRLSERANKRAADLEQRLADLEARQAEDQATLDGAEKRKRTHWSYNERESLEGAILLAVRDLTEAEDEVKARRGRMETLIALLEVLYHGKTE